MEKNDKDYEFENGSVELPEMFLVADLADKRQTARTMTTMKFYITILFSILMIGLFGQTADSLGLDDNPRLTKYEAEYFNNEFNGQRNSFDFADKKIAFITGSSAGKHLTKTEYFKEVKARLKDNHGMTHTPVVLTEEEKLKSGGYDAVVTSWVKLLTDKRRRQIISELKILNKDG